MYSSIQVKSPVDAEEVIVDTPCTALDKCKCTPKGGIRLSGEGRYRAHSAHKGSLNHKLGHTYHADKRETP